VSSLTFGEPESSSEAARWEISWHLFTRLHAARSLHWPTRPSLLACVTQRWSELSFSWLTKLSSKSKVNRRKNKVACTFKPCKKSLSDLIRIQMLFLSCSCCECVLFVGRWCRHYILEVRQPWLHCWWTSRCWDTCHTRRQISFWTFSNELIQNSSMTCFCNTDPMSLQVLWFESMTPKNNSVTVTSPWNNSSN